MPTKTFQKEDLLDLIDGFGEDLKLVESEIIDTSRWSIINEIVFEDLSDGKFYSTTYSVGATECQDESPWEYDGDEIECYQVEPVEVTKIEYQAVKAQ